MDIAANDTHYMTIPAGRVGLIRQDFQYELFKNGQVDFSTEIAFMESMPGTYTVSFQNDGEHKSAWTLNVWEALRPSVKYTETWRVVVPVSEKGIAQIRAILDAQGGRFNI
jgi:hypothetical protein